MLRATMLIDFGPFLPHRRKRDHFQVSERAWERQSAALGVHVTWSLGTTAARGFEHSLQLTKPCLTWLPACLPPEDFLS